MPEHNLQPLNRLRIMIEAEGPLLLGGSLRNESNVTSSLKFVAGSAWRGAIARVILDDLGLRKRGWDLPQRAPTAEFEEVFGGPSPAHFGYLYPLRLKADEATSFMTMPSPLTARTCKLHGGYPSTSKGHGVQDGLFELIRQAAASDDRQADRQADRMTVCQKCKERLERFDGYIGVSESGYQEAKLHTKSFVRVGLNRYTETAQERMLFVQDALVLGTRKNQKTELDEIVPLTFVGHWQGTDSQTATFRTLLDEHLIRSGPDSYDLRIGSAKARGLGKVTLHVEAERESARSSETNDAIASRLAAFQQQIQPETAMDSANLYASLTLRAPLQLLDQTGLPTAVFDREQLGAYVPTVPSSIEMVRKCSVIQQEDAGGWSGAWGMPKPISQVLSAGSVIVLQVKQKDKEAFDDFLGYIAQFGLGEQRSAGWGDLLICDEFHQVHKA